MQGSGSDPRKVKKRKAVRTAERAGDELPSRLAQAVAILHKRDTREDKPDGSWEDEIWLPSAGERRPCCGRIKPPEASSGGAKMRLFDHCRSLEHVACLCAVSPADLRRAFREAGYRIGRVRGESKSRRRPRAAELLGVASLRLSLDAPLHRLHADLLTAIHTVSQRLDALKAAVQERGELTVPAEMLEHSMMALRTLVLQTRLTADVARLSSEAQEALLAMRQA